MQEILDNFKLKQAGIVENFSKEIKTLRTGRANSAMVENITIEVYGTRSPLQSMAQINIPEARQIVIEPYDKSIIKDIQKDIAGVKANLNPVIDGNLIRIKLPEMTEESRRNLAKALREKLEKSRVAVRLARDEAKREMEKLRGGSKITKDDCFSGIEKLDANTSQINKELEGLTKTKEEEIMTV